MLGALGQAFPADPLERLKSMFLYDNLLTLHLGKYHKGAGKGGRIINPHITQDTSKPSFYKTITKVTPDHDKVMTNFIEDVKDFGEPDSSIGKAHRALTVFIIANRKTNPLKSTPS